MMASHEFPSPACQRSLLTCFHHIQLKSRFPRLSKNSMVLKSKNHMFHLVSSIVSIMFIHFLYASIGWSKDPINFQQLTPSPSAAPTVHPAVQFWGAATACDPSHRSWSRPPTSGREPGPLEIYEEIIGNLYRESTIESGFAWWPSNKYMIFHDIPISIPQFFLFLFPTGSQVP